MAEPLTTFALPCPECRENGHGGMARIGNRRKMCATCNSFAQAVMRRTRKQLLAKHLDEYEEIRLRVEADLYPGVIEAWSLDHGLRP